MMFFINIGILITTLISLSSPLKSESKFRELKDYSRFEDLFKRKYDFFSSQKGYSLEKFEQECKGIQTQIAMNKCSYIDTLFMMDNLRPYLNDEEILEVKNSINKTCHILYKAYERGSLYTFKVNSCVGETLNNLAKYGAFPVSPVWVWKGSEYDYLQKGKYEISP